MKRWKVVILLAGLAGLVGFFLPMAQLTSGDGSTLSFTALDIMRAKDSAASSSMLDKAKEVGKEYEVTAKTTAKLDAQLSQGVMALKGIIAAFFIPALLLAVLGLSGVVRGRFGRAGAILALLLGLISAAVWGVFYLGARDAQAGGEGAYALGLGLHLLLIAGLGGVLGGIGNLVAPDRGRAT